MSIDINPYSIEQDFRRFNMSYYQHLDNPDVREYVGVGEQGALLLQSTEYITLEKLVLSLPSVFKGVRSTPLHTLVHFYRYVGVSNYFKVVQGAEVLNSSDLDEFIKEIVGDPFKVPKLQKKVASLN